MSLGKKCYCNSRDLFHFGCKCNGSEPFYLWENGIDIVIARNEDEARKIVIDTAGYEGEDLELADGDSGWSIIDSKREITINEDEGVHTTLSAEKWVLEINKPEYLGSTEW